MNPTDNELALSLQLALTKRELCEVNVTMNQLWHEKHTAAAQALMQEQERRAEAAKQEPPKEPVSVGNPS